jgi:hypothetical protein
MDASCEAMTMILKRLGDACLGDDTNRSRAQAETLDASSYN